MEKTTILMIVHNQKELLCKSIEAIRNYTALENLQVVVVDNASEDDTKEWLEMQEDIAYAVEEVFNEKWGKLANEAIELLEIEGDILLMQPGCLITAGCIELLKLALYTEDNIVAVGPLINGLNKGMEPHLFPEESNSKNVLELDEEMVMLRGDILTNCFDRKFEEDYYTYKFTILDFYLRAIKKGKKLYCIKNAVAMYIENEQNEFSHLQALERKNLVEKWGMKYFNTMSNRVLIDMIEKKKDEEFSVLEIGCDCGATLFEIKNIFPNAKVYGYEINSHAADIAKSFAEVKVGNVEEEQFEYKEGQFDYILFGDVLEHLHNPERAIAYCRSFLNESGCIIACIPNLMHISVVGKLLEGYFQYTDTGLLDKTHIHFFTFNEILIMFENVGYKVEKVTVKNTNIDEGEQQMIDKIMSITTSSERWMFEAFQYVLRCQKKI